MPVSTVRNRAFSLIELVIVVVIIGIIAAIAIPRMSRGATGAAENSLKADLAVLRNAIELFQTENGGNYPATAAGVVQALTGFSDGNGGTMAFAAVRPVTHSYGPYLKEVPKLPMGTNKDLNAIGLAAAAGIAWVYDTTTHDFKANTGNATYDAW
jgi:prepilin-type N-terminal cleavage/methylation domain-containing protein